MSRFGADRVIDHAWNLICDRCGFKIKNKDSKQEWNGLVVCVDCFELRHQQDFYRIENDDQSVPFTRPDAPITYSVDRSTWDTDENTEPSGTFNKTTL